MARVEEFSLPGSYEVYEETLASGAVTIKTGFAEIYDWSWEYQSGQAKAGGEQLLGEVLVSGNISATTDVGDAGIPIVADVAGAITRVTAYLETTGDAPGTVSEADTTIDVNIDGTTIFTTQSNRLTIAHTADDGSIDTETTIENDALSAGSEITVDVDTVPTSDGSDTAPTNLRVKIWGVLSTIGPGETITGTITTISGEEGEQIALQSDNDDSTSQITVTIRGRR